MSRTEQLGLVLAVVGEVSVHVAPEEGVEGLARLGLTERDALASQAMILLALGERAAS